MRSQENGLFQSRHCRRKTKSYGDTAQRIVRHLDNLVRGEFVKSGMA